jgi:hypothetical protein
LSSSEDLGGAAHENTNQTATAGSPEGRAENSIYQKGRRVAEVLDTRIDLRAREIQFGEIYHSDELLIPDDCEFREYRILIQTIKFASRQEAGAPHKGRVLKGVIAEILGSRQP